MYECIHLNKPTVSLDYLARSPSRRRCSLGWRDRVTWFPRTRTRRMFAGSRSQSVAIPPSYTRSQKDRGAGSRFKIAARHRYERDR